jgi:aspartate aminotransferase-like enzyme
MERNSTNERKNPTLLDFGDATPYNHDEILEELKKRKYDAVTMVINETSTGIENNTYEINKILREYPETLLLTDAVTAAFGTNINTDESDVLIFGTQKALALPPGLSIAIINNKAIKRAKDVKNRGYYFDYIAMKKNAEKNFTLTTPAIPLFNALLEKLEDIKKEGLNNYIQKHKELAKIVREEMINTGFELLVDETNASNTLTVIKNTKNITIKEIQENMKREGYELASGYGKLKDETFRIGHMGVDEQTTKDAIKAIRKICEKHGA